MRAAENVAEVARTAGEAGAQLTDDEPEAVAVGPAHDVADEVDRNRGAGLLHGHAAAVGEALVRGARLAVHEVLADQRLRADLAASVLAQVGQPGLCDLRLHEGHRPLADLRDLEGLRLPGPHAGDLEVATLGQPERVVEEQFVGLAPGVFVVLGAHGQGGSAHDPEHQRDHRDHALHGPTDLWFGSQSSAAASSAEKTLLPSAAGSSFAPGQRRNCFSFGPAPKRISEKLIQAREKPPLAS